MSAYAGKDMAALKSWRAASLHAGVHYRTFWESVQTTAQPRYACVRTARLIPYRRRKTRNSIY